MYDVFLQTEPPRDSGGRYTTVVAAVQLPTGIWHCLVTEKQLGKIPAAITFTQLDAVHKTGDPKEVDFDGVPVTRFIAPKGSPAHVFGDRIHTKDPDKETVWLAGESEPQEIETEEVKPVEVTRLDIGR